MRDFNEFSALWRAPLFRRAFYQDVGARWRGIGMKYLMLVTAIIWLIVLIQATVRMTGFINGEAAAAFAKFPPITLKGGKASSPVAQPYIVRDDAGRAIFVLDTTGATHKPSDVGAKILVTETEMIQEQSRGHVEVRSLAGFPDMTVDSANLLFWTKMFRNFLIPLALPLMWGLVLAYRLVVALALAGIGLVMALGFGAKLSFAAMMRLAMVAMTADMLLGLLLSFVPISLGCGGWFFGHALSLGYLVYAVKVNADVQRDERMAFPVEPLSTPMPLEEGDRILP